MTLNPVAIFLSFLFAGVPLCNRQNRGVSQQTMRESSRINQQIKERAKIR